jgi:hypothetical protein
MWRDLVLVVSDIFRGSTMTATTTIAPPERWSLGVRARRLPGCDRQGRADSDRERLVLTVVVVVRWSRNLDVIFIMFEVICTSDDFFF